MSGLFRRFFMEELMKGWLFRNQNPASPPDAEQRPGPDLTRHMAPHPDFRAFEILVDTARGIAQSRRELLRPIHRNTMSTAHWRKEFCTVTINMGRRAGHTHYINTHAGIDDLVIVPRLNRGYAQPDRARVIALVEVGIWLETVGRNLDFRTVYLDGCSSLLLSAPISLWHIATEEYVALG